MKSKTFIALTLALLLAGCAAWLPRGQEKHSASVVDYLYGPKESPAMTPGMAVLKLPLRVGVAFVPSSRMAMQVPEAEQARMLDKVRQAFSQQGFIAGIEIIPAAYLRPAGGFANLEQAARLFNVDVAVLLSHDQVQFNDSNSLSLLYWTIVGAYLIHGDQYDIHTMLEATVFDVGSHKLLFRAPGISNVKGGASLASFSERSRAARLEGFDKALDAMIPNLQKELDAFKQRVKTDAQVRVEHREGYRGGGDLGWLALLPLLALPWLAWQARRLV